jgi:hypothetical protein
MTPYQGAIPEKTPAATPDLSPISVQRFVFVMKAIAENEAWDDVVFHFEENGHSTVMVSAEQIDLLREVLNHKLGEGDPLNRRGHRFLRCVCRPPRPPVTPVGGGGDAGGGHPQ